MADGLCSLEIDCSGNDVNEKTKNYEIDDDEVLVIDRENTDRMNDVSCENVKSAEYLISSDSDRLLFDKLCESGRNNNNINNNNVDVVNKFLERPCSSPSDEDCRKKRCVDRYDSSESSDSGVAVLSCTDCSGSSTASSDITDPGSPFSTASSHSEDSSASQHSAKMPPTQSAHHPAWPWNREDSPPLKRPAQDRTAFTKRHKVNNNNNNNVHGETKAIQATAATMLTMTVPSATAMSTPTTTTTCINNNTNMTSAQDNTTAYIITTDKRSNGRSKKQEKQEFCKQVKITSFFKSQMKATATYTTKSAVAKNELSTTNTSKPVPKTTNISSNNNNNIRKVQITPVVKKNSLEHGGSRPRKLAQVTVHRRILPAPSKLPEKIPVNNVTPMPNFPSAVAFTAVPFPHNLAYIHAKTPKPPDSIFIPTQFQTLTADKLNAIPIVNRPCINVIQPLSKIGTINGFNCVKLNATVVPIVKLNALAPSSSINNGNSSSNNNPMALNVETASPTVLSAKPKTTATDASLNLCNSTVMVTAKQMTTTTVATTAVSASSLGTLQQQNKCLDEQSPPDSDSGISSKDSLEISVSQSVVVECQKSPILSQPKTIRFPAKKQEKIEIKDVRPRQEDDADCRWAECHAKFDTSGALLEHLQVNHVISQATQEQYVCLWMGCKVHGRTSCSRSWLERHVLAHAGTKPFRCIVDGCGFRFSSQSALERHVNNHFNSDSTLNSSAKKVENASAKLFKRNGKKIRFRRQPWSARMFDFIDSGIMEGVQHRLLIMTEKRTMGQFKNSPGDTLTLHSQIVARRTESDGKRKLLLRWHPEDIIPDEWILEKEYVKTKTIPIPSLNISAKDTLSTTLFPSNNERQRQKARRKPLKQT